MSIEQIHTAAQEKMEKSLEAFKQELARIRTGKAHVSVLDAVRVNYYGVPTPLNQVANLSAPEPRLLMVQPWDKGIIGEIEKAIQKADLGLNPSNDGTVIRLPLPQLTQETREELAKQARKVAEDGKVHIHNIRRDANDDVKKLEKAKEITEDDSKYEQEEIQKLTDSYIKKIDDIVKEKEKDILEI